MTTLFDYLRANAIRRPSDGAQADVFFFGVDAAPGARADKLKEAMREHKGEFCEVDPLDGQEHNYIELGGWVGEQGAALELMGLGAALGAWKVLTPRTVLGKDAPLDLMEKMAGMGYVSMQA